MDKCQKDLKKVKLSMFVNKQLNLRVGSFLFSLYVRSTDCENKLDDGVNGKVQKVD